jgi:methionyl aminopeptidase
MASIKIKSKEDIKELKKVGDIVTLIAREVKKNIQPGMTTKDIESMAVELFEKYNVRSAFLGYRGYPAHICVSINSEVVHGIPNEKRIISNGDIVSVDIGICKNGWYGDIAFSIGIGEMSPVSRNLLKVTEEAIYYAAENAVYPGKRIGDIGWAIQSFIEKHQFSAVRDYGGHGIGRELHEEPSIPNFGNPSEGIALVSGMVFTLEPMANVGHHSVKVLSDGWTVVTCDGSISAHFEQMVCITEKGHEFLTGKV